MHTLPKPVVGLHLDCKGVMFKPSRIEPWLDDLTSQGVNTLLVEYEDIFPYRAVQVAHDPQTAWTRRTLGRFLTAAKQRRVTVIPLLQCLGHLEYLLGWQPHRALAADPVYPSTIDVTNPAAVDLVVSLLEDLITSHPDSAVVHLGMDEAHGLHVTAKRHGVAPLKLFMTHLHRLLDVVEAHGKTACIWTDMIQDNLDLKLIKSLRGRSVIMCEWEYVLGDEPYATRVRLGGGGYRVSRQWLDDPDHPQAPVIGPNTKFVEDLPAGLRQVLKPHTQGRTYRTHLTLDLFTKLGLPCLPVSAVRFSSNGPVIPPYGKLAANIRGWSDALARTGQLGQIASSWARGNTWCWPNYNVDLAWPLIAELGRSMGAKPKPFFPGIPAATLRRLILTLGRCQSDWRLEAQVADEMEALLPRVKAHQYEWRSIILMARTLHLQRVADGNLAEVDCFHANHRPIAGQWQRRYREQQQTIAALRKLRQQVARHFRQHYHGHALEEWVSTLFDLRIERLQQVGPVCQRKAKLAAKFYGER